MESSKKHMDDLSEIRSMMERASKFISLSGLAGVFAGIFALVGAAVAYWYLEIFLPQAEAPLMFKSLSIYDDGILFMLILAVVVLLLAFASAVFFTTRNSRKRNFPLWDHTSKKVLINLLVPLIAGAIFIFALIFYGNFVLIIPASIIFYGLSLINAGHFTYSDIKFLGYVELLVGFVSLFLIDYGLIIWTISFGLLHIIYGVVMYNKYERS